MTDLPADWFNQPLAEVDPEIAAVLRRNSGASATPSR